MFIFSGYYCVPNLVVPGDVSSVMSECPDGFFCPNGTGYNWDGCPAGTFGNAPRLTQASECTPCTAGYYCQGTLNSFPASSHHQQNVLDQDSLSAA